MFSLLELNSSFSGYLGNYLGRRLLGGYVRARIWAIIWVAGRGTYAMAPNSSNRSSSWTPPIGDFLIKSQCHEAIVRDVGCFFVIILFFKLKWRSQVLCHDLAAGILPFNGGSRCYVMYKIMVRGAFGGL
jgi:hypothetical protein